MADDTANLNLKVDSSQVKSATRNLKKLDSQAGKTERAAGSITSSFAKMAGAIGLVATALAGASKLIQVAREFDVLNASLVTVTGSTEAAAAAFKQIEDFAATTPFALNEVANAFVKLKAFGLDPSEEAITSFGNTASAMGKSLNQVIEAVADAATGEFERLKEFGIKAKSEGDRVTFTFRGVKTEVGKNAKEIEQFIKGIGEVDFAGAMARRADTLDGALSNLGDTWDKLFRVIAASGVGDIIEDTTRKLTEALDLAIQFIQGPQLEEILKLKEERLASGATLLGFKFFDEEQLQREIAALKAAIAIEKEKFVAEQQAVEEDALPVFGPAFDADIRNQQVKAMFEFEEEQTKIAQEAADQRVMIAQMEAANRQAALGNMMSNLSSLMNSKSKELFNIGKTAAIAETVIGTYSSAQKAFNALAGIPIVGPALGAAAAGAAIAAGLVRVNAIQSTQFGSATVSSGAGASSGGAPVSSQLPPQPAGGGGVGQAIDITLVGGAFSTENIRDLIVQIADVSQDMGNLDISVSA